MGRYVLTLPEALTVPPATNAQLESYIDTDRAADLKLDQAIVDELRRRDSETAA